MFPSTLSWSTTWVTPPLSWLAPSPSWTAPEIELPQTVGQCEDTVRGGIDTGRELRCTAGKSGCAVTCGNHVVGQRFRARRQFAGSGVGSVHSGRELECSVGGLLQTCTRVGQSDQDRLDGLRADLVADLTEDLLGGVLADDGAEVVVDVVEGELQLSFVGGPWSSGEATASLKFSGNVREK